MLQQKQRLVSPVVRVHGSASQGRPLQELLVLFSFILESTKISCNLSLSFALISLLADDKVIGMNWNRLVVARVCVCVCGWGDLTVWNLLWNHSEPMCRPCQSSQGFYVNPCTNKFVSPHPRASGDGYVVPGDRRAAIQQQAAYLERLVLSAPLLGDKSFKDTHYLTIVVASPL